MGKKQQYRLSIGKPCALNEHVQSVHSIYIFNMQICNVNYSKRYILFLNIFKKQFFCEKYTVKLKRKIKNYPKHVMM